MATSTGLNGGTHYDVLGVPANASAEDIKRAYRRMLRQTHPDVGGSTLIFRLVQEAWETLSDPNRRAAYDRSTGGGSSSASSGSAGTSGASESDSQRRAREAREEAYRREQERARENTRKRQQWARERAEQERESAHERAEREYREARDRRREEEVRRKQAEEERRRREQEEQRLKAERQRRREAERAAELAKALPEHEKWLARIHKANRRVAVSYDGARAKLIKDKNMRRLLNQGASVASLWDVRVGQRKRFRIVVWSVLAFMALHIVGWYVVPPLALLVFILIPFLFGWAMDKFSAWIYPQFTAAPLVDELHDRTQHLQNLQRRANAATAAKQAAWGTSASADGQKNFWTHFQ